MLEPLSYAQFKERVWLSGRPSLVLFYSEGCYLCIEVKVVLSDVLPKYPEIQFACIEADQEPELLKKFRIDYIPTIIGIDETHGIRSVSGGVPGPEAISALIKATLSNDDSPMADVGFEPPKPPSYRKRALTFARSMAGVLWFFLKTGQIKSSKAETNQRLRACLRCPFYTLEKSHPTCSLCGCRIKVKASMTASTCPDGRW